MHRWVPCHPLLTLRAIVLLHIVSIAAIAQPTTEPAVIKTGTFDLTFTESSPLSAIELQNQRYRIPIEPDQRYKLAEHSFEVHVPPDYEPAGKPFGVMVWINANARATLPRGIPAVLEAHRLIGISAADAGNNVGLAVRIGLALDAVHNLSKQYKIDEGRIYAGGISGGGKVAGILATLYPEAFDGALTIVGVSYFRDIPSSSKPGTSWEANFNRPGGVLLDRARSKNRFVLMTGSEDFNRDPIKDIYTEGFLKDRFKYVKYVEIPDQGHGLPTDMKWIDEAIDYLDSAIDSSPVRPAAPTSRSSPAPASAPAAATKADPETAAAQLLSLAQNYENNRLYPQARERLERLLKEYPASKSAAAAKVMLQRIKAAERR